ncbi:hypothetical protein [Hymenobacter sp. PAMC 26628]|uniref:hypothetical protein n=1 Tax=Hymenobacter sp. PAMC 26628 TaxID=1484118 RepID=UPI0007705402|nr:hypothetical protein [Hymenobacter sp. PAMC 26628]AMJ67327.1 hypothetical protein AXW84_19315 [Hymenobacter sp. PAMC 26628]
MSLENLLHPALRLLAGAAGTVQVVITLSAAVRSFVLPRSESVRLNNHIFSAIRLFFDFAASRANNYARRDRIMAHYAPVALVALPIAWLTLVCLGYTAIYWALGLDSWLKCYELSGSSLLTLGTTSENGLLINIFNYSEATLGLLLLTLLLSYLPTLYQAFSRREVTVSRLELRAGTPATSTHLIDWLNSSGSLADDDLQWAEWEQWFVEIEESHTSLPILSFFRSPQPGRSWVMTAGLILDTANLIFSALDVPHTRQMELTFKAGSLAMNRVYRFFDVKAVAVPSAELPGPEPGTDPAHSEFSQALNDLAALGVSLCPDRATAWAQFQERRKRYAPALNYLAELTMSPETRSL